jgi:benzaldehyde dehydrogenase (NAD)
LALADRIPSGIVHINDQTVADDIINPFGGVRASGGGGRLGGHPANFDAFTEVQWVTLRGDLPSYPF